MRIKGRVLQPYRKKGTRCRDGRKSAIGLGKKVSQFEKRLTAAGVTSAEIQEKSEKVWRGTRKTRQKPIWRENPGPLNQTGIPLIFKTVGRIKREQGKGNIKTKGILLTPHGKKGGPLAQKFFCQGFTLLKGGGLANEIEKRHVGTTQTEERGGQPRRPQWKNKNRLAGTGK